MSTIKLIYYTEITGVSPLLEEDHTPANLDFYSTKL